MASKQDVINALERGRRQGWNEARERFEPKPPPLLHPPRQTTPYNQLPLNTRFQLAALAVAQGTSSIRSSAYLMQNAREFLAEGMKMLDDLLTEVEAVATHPYASAMSASGQDAQRLEAKPASAVPLAGDAR